MIQNGVGFARPGEVGGDENTKKAVSLATREKEKKKLPPPRPLGVRRWRRMAQEVEEVKKSNTGGSTPYTAYANVENSNLNLVLKT